MAEPLAFLNIKRRSSTYRPVAERVGDYQDVALPPDEGASREQASRCINCGLPFCHWRCPLGNYVPTWNQYVATGRWAEAYHALQATNNMPEFTGRLCPALCEAACVLGINEDAVTVRENELAVVEHAFQSGLVKPHPPVRRTGKTVAVIGSGPAGLACADQLNKAGHAVTVFERDERVGGLLRYGIPDFKLEKWVIDRRVKIWEAEGIRFETGVHVGVTYPVATLLQRFDAVALAAGARQPRDLPIPGRELRGIHFALDYLAQSNRRVAGQPIPPAERIDARGKAVIVIGGGDTGADCVGTAHRQAARQVVQLELLPRPPERRGPNDRWPDQPVFLRTSSSHEEGGVREWSVLTKQFLGEGGAVRRLSCVRVDCAQPDKSRPPAITELPGTAFALDADLVLLAMGFVAPERRGLVEQLGVRLDARGQIATNEQHETSVRGVFAAGDMRRGQSLIVWAISEGRTTAHYIDHHLMGRSDLPLM